MSQQIFLPSVCAARQFHIDQRQNRTLWQIRNYHPCKDASMASFFVLATAFVHQWRQYQAEARTVQLVSCGGRAETIYLWRRETIPGQPPHHHHTLPISVRMTDDMWHMAVEIGTELGYIRSPDTPPEKVPDETMANIMSSIWDMYLVVCSRVLIGKNRVKVPSRKAVQAFMAPNGTVLMPKVPGDRARTIPLV